jgi:hypothetical protein
VGTECKATTLSIETLRNGTGSLPAEVLAHIKKYELTLIDPATTYWSCVDGRSEFAVLGTPGGDAAEFATALSIYSENGGNVTTEEQVMDLFVAFLQTLPVTRQFYLHTDSHAEEALVEKLLELLQLPNTTHIEIKDVPYYKQAAVKDLALDPKHIGCGHLRLLTTYPLDYQVPYNYTAWTIRVFFDFLWNHENYTRLNLHKSTPRFVVNQGDHEERAVINVISKVKSTGPKCQNLIPRVIPRNPSDRDSIFINHISHVGVLRNQLVSFFSRLPGSIPANDFMRIFNDIGTVQLGLTVGYLAAGEPVYAVTINVDEVFIDIPDVASSASKLGSLFYLLLLLALYLR